MKSLTSPLTLPLLPLLLLLLLLLLLRPVSGRSGGAPLGACATFTPGHSGIQAQTSASPYAITFSPSTYTAGGPPITVTLSTTSGATFKGFLLAAQPEDSCKSPNLMPGTFTPAGNSKLTCDNGSITHSSHNEDNSRAFQWTPPATSEGNIRFRATFVRQYNTFWVNVKSADVLVDSAVGSGGTTCTTQNPSATQPPASVGSITKDPACGVTKGCYSSCGSDCKFLMTWAPGASADKILITMSAKIGSNQYIAVGLSKDGKMGDDSVHICVNDGTGAYSSYNPAKYNEMLQDEKAGLSSSSVTYQDGVLTCTFSRTVAGGSNGKLFPLDKAYSLFWAEGPAFGKSISRHSGLPLISSSAASLQDFTVDISGDSEFMLVKVHGSIMVAAWIFFASIGIVVARFYKNVWEDKKWCDQKIWFQIHRTCMVLCFLATVAAFIVIFIEVEGYSEIEGETYKKAHPILGIAVTALAVTNPIMALFRPHPGTPKRPIFNWLHWGVGTVAHILAVIAVFFGMELDKAGAPGYITYILLGYVAWQVLISLVLEIVQCCTRNSDARSNKYEMTDRTSEPSENKSSPQASSIKPILLIVHIVVITAFAVTIIVVLNVGHDHDDH